MRTSALHSEIASQATANGNRLAYATDDTHTHIVGPTNSNWKNSIKLQHCSSCCRRRRCCCSVDFIYFYFFFLVSLRTSLHFYMCSFSFNFQRWNVGWFQLRRLMLPFRCCLDPLVCSFAHAFRFVAGFIAALRSPPTSFDVIDISHMKMSTRTYADAHKFSIPRTGQKKKIRNTKLISMRRNISKAINARTYSNIPMLIAK